MAARRPSATPISTPAVARTPLRRGNQNREAIRLPGRFLGHSRLVRLGGFHPLGRWDLVLHGHLAPEESPLLGRKRGGDQIAPHAPGGEDFHLPGGDVPFDAPPTETAETAEKTSENLCVLRVLRGKFNRTG